MKRYKNQERTDVYNRAHHIIYPSGRVPKDQRTRIAIIISGDEQIVVEDRVKILTLNEGLMKREGHTVPFVTPELHTKKENIWVRVRLVDTSSGNYAYRNDLVVEGKVHGSAWTKSGNFNGRLIERGVERAMTEAMNDIEIEKD